MNILNTKQNVKIITTKSLCICNCKDGIAIYGLIITYAVEKRAITWAKRARQDNGNETAI